MSLLLNPPQSVEAVFRGQKKAQSEMIVAARRMAKKLGESFEGKNWKDAFDYISSHQDAAAKIKDSITIENIYGKTQQAVIHGLVALQDVKTDPDLSQTSLFVKSNPLENPPLDDTAYVAVSSIISAIGANKLSEFVQAKSAKYFVTKTLANRGIPIGDITQQVLQILTPEETKKVETYARLAGIGSSIAGGALSTIATHYIYPNDEIEKGMIAGTAISVVLQAITWIMSQKAASQTQVPVSTASGNQITASSATTTNQTEEEKPIFGLEGFLTRQDLQRLRSGMSDFNTKTKINKQRRVPGGYIPNYV